MTNYVVASSKTWFKEHLKSSEYKKLSIHEISTKKDLNLMNLDAINPRYIFFPHWSHLVPLQNLTSRGLKNTGISALKMSEEITKKKSKN